MQIQLMIIAYSALHLLVSFVTFVDIFLFYVINMNVVSLFADLLYFILATLNCIVLD